MIELTGDGVAVLPTGTRRRSLPRLHLPLGHEHGMWIALVVAVALRLMAMSTVPLIPEEAYYWVYSQNPQLSYYDHPPMVAWVIRLGTMLFGDTELGVRVGGMALLAGASVLMYWLARLWFDRTTAFVATLLLQILPVYFGMSLLAPMDSALCFFWVACLFGVSHALRSGRPGGWYVAGAALGGAMLSKYSAIFLAAGVVLAVVGNRDWRRRHLLSIHPYLAVALAAALFSPVIVWNALHEWASFRFQFVERYAADRFNLHTFPTFLGLQLMALTPVPVVAVGFLMARFARRWRGLPAARMKAVVLKCPPKYWFAIASCLPGLAAATWTSLRSSVHVNWTAPIFLGVLPAACAFALAHDRLLSLRQSIAPDRATTHRRWQRAMITTVTACGGAAIGLMLVLLVVQPRLRFWSAFGPWHELAAVVEEQEDKMEDKTGREPRIVGAGKYRLASVLAFYRMPIELHRDHVVRYTTSQWIFGDEGLGYEYWSKRADWVGVDVVYVAETRDRLIEQIRPWFESVEQVSDPRLLANKKAYEVIIGHKMRASPQAAAGAAGDGKRSKSRTNAAPQPAPGEAD